MNEAGREKQLLDSIHELRLLRDAQDPEGVLRVRFQRDIEALTAELIELRRVAPDVEQLDVLIARAEQRFRQTGGADGSSEDPWSPVAVLFGVVGVVLLLVSLWLGWNPLVGAGLVLGAALALLGSVRWRRETHLSAEMAQEELRQLHVQRNALMGGAPASAPPDRLGPAVIGHGDVHRIDTR